MFTLSPSFEIGEENYRAAKKLLRAEKRGELDLTDEQRRELRRMVQKYISERALL